jgi:DNA-binding protein YbaB
MAFDPIPDPATFLPAVFNIERQLAQLDQALEAARHTAASADNAVTAVASGTPRMISLVITQTALDAAHAADTFPALVTTVRTVCNQALGKAQDASVITTAGVAQGLSLQGVCVPNGPLPNLANFAETAAALTAQVPVIDDRLVARIFTGVVGPVTALVNGHFEVTGLTVDGFPVDAEVLAGQTVRAINLAIEQGKVLIDQVITDTTGTVPTNTVTLGEVCLYARGAMDIEDRVTTKTAAGAFAAVVNVGTTQTNIGSLAQVGNVWSNANVFLRSNGVVNGTVKTSQGFSAQNNPPNVTGGVFTNAFIQVPALSLAVTFPTNPGGGSIILEPPSPPPAPQPPPTVIQPGAFKIVHVKSRRTLRVVKGTYTFDELMLEPESTLEIDSRTGRVIIHVKGGTLFTRGTIKSIVAGRPDFFLSYFGVNDLSIDTPFPGTIVAQTAKIVLASVNPPAQHSGAFFAQNILVRPGNNILFVPYTGSPSLGTF